MSNKNNKVKRLEKIVKVEMGGLQEDVRLLNEENSELRRLLDEQNDYIKQNFKEIQEALTDHYQYQSYLQHRLTNEIHIRRNMDNRLRSVIAEASSTFLGKYIFK